MQNKSIYFVMAFSFIFPVSAYATTPLLTLDLELASGGKYLCGELYGVGQTVTLNLYAILNASDSDSTNDYFGGSEQRFTSVESYSGFMGDYTSVSIASSFMQEDDCCGSQNNYDSNSDKEWGGELNSADITGYMINATTAYVTGTKILLGTITWTVTSLGISGDFNPFTDSGTVTLNVAPYEYEDIYGNLDFCVDGVNYWGDFGNLDTSSGLVAVGDPVVIDLGLVPEPSMFALLGTGLLSALIYCWRKRR